LSPLHRAMRQRRLYAAAFVAGLGAQLLAMIRLLATLATPFGANPLPNVQLFCAGLVVSGVAFCFMARAACLIADLPIHPLDREHLRKNWKGYETICHNAMWTLVLLAMLFGVYGSSLVAFLAATALLQTFMLMANCISTRRVIAKSAKPPITSFR
jgi:hypothetical protein